MSFARKWLSTAVVPAFCASCGGYSYAQPSSGSTGLVVGAFLITLGGFGTLAAKSIWPLLGAILLALGFYLWHWHRVPIEELSPRQVSQARMTQGLSLFAVMLALMSS